jgi:ankyrin repeat protein
MPLQQAMENLQEFAEELGLSGIEFDENNTCILGIDNNFSMHLTYEPNSERLYIYSPLLDEFPKNPAVLLKLFTMLLQAGMLGAKLAGGGVGIALKEQLVLMHCTLDMHPDVRGCALKDFAPLYVETVENMREECAKIAALDNSSSNILFPPALIDFPDLEKSDDVVNKLVDNFKGAPPSPNIRVSMDNLANISRKRENQPLATDMLFEIIINGNNNDLAETLSTIRDLVSNQADINKQEEVTGKTPLIYAVSNKYHEVVSLLLGLGSNINLQDFEGNSPLHHAVLARDIEMVKKLFEKNADIITTNQKEQSPLHFAAALGMIEIIEEILSQAETQQVTEVLLELVTNKGNTALQATIKSKKIENVEIRQQIILKLKEAGAVISEDLLNLTHEPEISDFLANLLKLTSSENLITHKRHSSF